MDSLKVYVSWDGDSIGQRVGRATISDDVEEVRRVDQAIQAGNDVWRNWALAQGGSIVEIGGDEGRVEVPASALADLPQICETYKTAVDATVSVGLGRKLSESAKALLAAKLRGKNRIVLYDQTVEQTLAQAEQKPEDQKIAEEYLDKPVSGAPTAELFEKGEKKVCKTPGCGKPVEKYGKTGVKSAHCADCNKRADVVIESLDKAEGAGKGVTHAQAPSRQRVDHEEAEVAHAGDRKPIVTETSADVRNHLARAHGAAAAQEKRDRAAAARKSGDLEALRGQVAASLQAMQRQLPVMAQLKSAYPSTYQAVVGLMQSVIKMGQEIQKADDALEKAEDPEPAEPTELQAWAASWGEPLVKFQNTIEFPGLGIERRTDTPVVHTNQQHATRLGLIGAAVRRKWEAENTIGDNPKAIAHRLAAPAMIGGHRAASQKQMKAAAGRRTASPGSIGMVAPSGGGASPSFTISTEMMGKVKAKGVAASNFDPKEEASTVMHENFHHVVNRIDEKYGQGAGKAVVGWLAHQIPKPHLSMILNFATRHFKYKITNPNLREESIALLHNYLNNPTLRRSFQNNWRVQAERAAGKLMTPEESASHDRATDQMMKQAYHGIRRAAAALTPDQLKQIVAQRSGQSYGWTKAEIAEIDKGLLEETEDETGEPGTAPPELDKAAMPPHAKAHRSAPLPVGTTHNGEVKIQKPDGHEAWHSVRAGQVQSLTPDAPLQGANSYPVSSRNPGG